MNKKFTIGLALALILTLVVSMAALASSVDESIVDATAPTGSVTLNPGGSGPITINLSVTGNQVGTATFEVYRDWTLSGGAFTGSNPQTFTVPPRAAQDPATTFSTSGTVTVSPSQAADIFTLAVGAFNITNSNATGAKLGPGSSSNYQVTVEIPTPTDTAAPTISCTPPTDSIWYGADVTVPCAAADSESGLANPDDASFSLSTNEADGTETDSASTDTYQVCDKAGNCATAGPYTFKLDRKAPALSSCDAPDGAWHATDVTLYCDYTDDGSGPANQQVELVTNVLAGTETDNALASANGKKACDEVGNCADSPADIGGNKVDKKAPQLSSCDTPDGLWHANNVTLYCHYTDGGSGLSTEDVALETSIDAGAETSDAAASAGGKQACDNVGNCAPSPDDIGGNMVDRKAPTDITFVGSINDGDSFYFGFVPAAPTCTAVDGGSGLESCLVTGYDASVGTHELTATAIDNVGNSDTATISYTVLAWTLKGFYQPVDIGDLYNVVKGGSTVPLKFEVFAGSTELTDTAAVKSFVQTKVACDSDAILDEIEVVTTGGTSLRYDTLSGQFIQNWQTPKQPGTCYKVTMTTQDGSFLKAFFRLK